jgi:hypothetical protein
MEICIMDILEHLDLILGEALDCIVEISSELRQLETFDQKEMSKHLGKAISELWYIRDAVYRLRPDLKPDFVREHEHNKIRYDELSELVKLANKADGNSDFETATKLYEELRQRSRFGYFRMIAEAGLYRVSKSLYDSSNTKETPGEKGNTE